MRQFLASIAFVLGVFGGCSQSPENASDNAGDTAARAGVELFTVRAGPIANARVDSLDGTFQLLKVGAGNGIPSAGVGGACIAFHPADLGFTRMAAKTCSLNKDCMTDTEATVGAYCDVPSSTCWAKPTVGDRGNALCNRPITMAPNVVNHVPAQPGTATPYGVKPGARARVVACLNKAGIDPRASGCATVDGQDRIEVMGPVATLGS